MQPTRLEHDEIVTIRFLCKDGVPGNAFTDDLTHSLEEIFTVRGVSDDGAWMLGKDVKTSPMRRDPTGLQSTSLTSEFWRCWMKSHFIQFIRLLTSWEFPFELN
jgi:hypothetical protein